VAWLLNPDDYDALLADLCQVKLPRAGLGAIEVRKHWAIERGHIADSDHPEIGYVTFAEFGERYAKVMEAERVEFEKAMLVLGKTMGASLDEVTAATLQRGPVVEQSQIDTGELMLGLVDVCSKPFPWADPEPSPFENLKTQAEDVAEECKRSDLSKGTR
jgi:hypothetical protein